MTTVGTSHFVDRAAAETYYCGKRKKLTGGPYAGRTLTAGGLGYKPEDIDGMIAEGLIAIGKPTIPEGATLSVIKDEGRYQYTTA